MARKPKLGSGKRFKQLEAHLAHREGVRDPHALAAWIGAKKFGQKRMSKMAAHGRKG